MRCRALALGLPAHAYFGGPSAAFLLGVGHAATFADPVHIVVPAGKRLNQRQHATVHRMILDDGEVMLHHGLPITTPLRTSWDVAYWLETVPAVVIIDGLLNRGLITTDELGQLAKERFGRRGARRAERAFHLVDGNSQSPQESRLRVGIVRSGLPMPVGQFPVEVRGRILHPDLAWPEYKVAIEYDGEWHDALDQFHLDRKRLNLLVAEGWIVLHVTSRRMRNDFPGIVAELRQVLRSRGWRAR